MARYIYKSTRNYNIRLEMCISSIQIPSFEVTDCYKCHYFRMGGHFDCQKKPHPRYVSVPTTEPNVRYSVPCQVTWRNPDGMDIHCNSFVEYFKETLF